MALLQSSLLTIIKLNTIYPVYPFDFFTNIYYNSVWIVILLSFLVSAILFDKYCLYCLWMNSFENIKEEVFYLFMKITAHNRFDKIAVV